MKAITVTSWGSPPTYTPDLPSPPSPSDNEIRLKVLATGLHRLVRSQASGTHYSALNNPLPYVPGMDGVGLTPDNKRVYFVSMAKGGAFAEYINVPRERTVELSETADAVQVAALVNPGMSSWMAIRARVSGLNLSKGWSCVILGVTTQSGRVAVEFARGLGATRIVGVARDEGKMNSLGLDEMIVLKDKVEETEFGRMGSRVDVILDYLWGAPFAECVKQLKSEVPTQTVQIGSMAGLECELPSALLRSKDVTMRGSGPGSWSMELFAKETEGLVRAVEKLSPQSVVERGLGDVDEAFKDERARTVFVPEK